MEAEDHFMRRFARHVEVEDPRLTVSGTALMNVGEFGRVELGPAAN